MFPLLALFYESLGTLAFLESPLFGADLREGGQVDKGRRRKVKEKQAEATKTGVVGTNINQQKTFWAFSTVGTLGGGLIWGQIM